MKKNSLKFIENSVFKIAIGGIAVFLLGIFIGYNLENGMIASIQGYLFNAIGEATDPNATDSNATDSNATDSNATDSNATDSNATDSNATDSNASVTDNVLYLHSFDMDSYNVKAGQKVNVAIITSGAYNSGASLFFKNSSNNATFTTSVNLIQGNSYIVIPENVASGSYQLQEIILYGTNSDYTVFSRRYSSVNQNVDYIVDFLNKSVEVVKDETVITTKPTEQQSKLALNSISFNSTEAKVGDKVYIKYKTNNKVSSMKLTLEDENNSVLNVYVKSLTSNPYFEIPSTTLSGNYKLIGATLTNSTDTILYSEKGNVTGAEYFDFESSLKIIETEEKNVFVYNNEEIDNEIIRELYNVKDNVTINVNADNNPIISEELFNAIKGTNKKVVITYNDNEIEFNGKDVKNPKSIDVSIKVSTIDKNAEIAALLDDGIVVDFASNGNLPGKATIRIKITDIMESKLSNNKVYIYHYNEDSNDFTQIASEIKTNENGYYEFELNHNSKYVFVKKELSKDLINTQDKNVVNFQKSDKVNLLLVGLAIILIVFVVGIIVITKKFNKKKEITLENSSINTENNTENNKLN